MTTDKRLAEIREQCEHGDRASIDDTLWLFYERENLLAEVDRLRAEIDGIKVARNQPCGCITCICSGDERCYGCGATDCGKPECVFKTNRIEYTDHPLRAELKAVREIEGWIPYIETAEDHLREDGCKCPDDSGSCEMCSLADALRQLIADIRDLM